MYIDNELLAEKLDSRCAFEFSVKENFTNKSISPFSPKYFTSRSAPAEVYKSLYNDEIHALTCDEGEYQSKSFLQNHSGFTECDPAIKKLCFDDEKNLGLFLPDLALNTYS
jgi:hypothetical protein